MGLLEEAIREHLELQRRRGGDPTQIALAEREALEPLVPGHTPDWAEGPVLFDLETTTGPTEAPPGGAPAPPSGRPLVEPEQQPVAAAAQEQETAELDMGTVLGLSGDPAEAPFGYPAEEPPGPGDFGPVRARRIVPDPDPAEAPAEDFEWEIPGVTPSPRSSS